MNRRTFFRTMACLGVSGLVPSLAGRSWARAAGPRKPNIILIVADDLGYADLGVQGCKDVPTPHTDSIAKSGVRFTSGYVSCPVCSPTRAGLMTGRYQQRFGHEFNPGPAERAEADFGLPLDETTLAERLRQLGYRTGIVGKWHLGYRPEMHPQRRGFDEFFGFLGGGHPYLSSPARGGAILRGAAPVNETEYLTDAFAREAISFIERRGEMPFFLYLPFNAVHNPMQAAGKYVARFRSIPDQRRRTFASMLSAMDDAVGRVLATLREAKLEDSTLIFFISDNGGPTPATTSRNDPLRGYKGQVLEGGIRVPFFAQWKGRLPPGKIYEHPVIALDIVPTAVAAAGGTIPAGAALDGVNLLPYLAGSTAGAPHAALYWRFGPQAAIRKDDWKLVMQGSGPPQLYNLARDIGENDDLAAVELKKLKELKADYEAWNRQLSEPRWRVRRADRQRDRRRRPRQ